MVSLAQRIDKAGLLCYKHTMLTRLFLAAGAGKREAGAALRMPARMRGNEADPAACRHRMVLLGVCRRVHPGRMCLICAGAPARG